MPGPEYLGFLLSGFAHSGLSGLLRIAEERADTSGCAGIEDLSVHCEESPLVSVGEEGQPQDAPRLVVPEFAVLSGEMGLVKPCSAGPDGERAEPTSAVGNAVRIHWCEALVIVVVPGEQDACSEVVESPKEREGFWPVSMLPGTEDRVMPIAKYAPRLCGGEIGPKPSFLLGSSGSVDIAVQRDDVPGPEREAVIAPARLARAFAPVIVVRGSAFGLVFVVPRNRPGARLMAAPSGIIAIAEVLSRPLWISEIARDDDRPG